MSKKDLTFEEACQILDIVPSVPTLDAIPETYRNDVLDFYKSLVIGDALIKTIDDWMPKK